MHSTPTNHGDSFEADYYLSHNGLVSCVLTDWKDTFFICTA